MRRRSKKAVAKLAALPAIRSVSDDRTPVIPEDESFREFVRRLPCVVCLKPALRGDPCHNRVALHGDWLEHDGELVGNIYPACRLHHGEQHQRGIETFQATRGLSITTICATIGAAYQLGWSADGLGASALGARGYAIDVSQVRDGELPC